MIRNMGTHSKAWSKYAQKLPYHQAIQMFWVLVVPYLHVDGPVEPVSQGREGVSARGRVEIRASCYSILPRVRRSAVAPGQIVMLEVIVPSIPWQGRCRDKRNKRNGNL